MSATEPASPDDLVEVFGITATEAQAIADAFAPVSSVSGAVAGVGSAMEDAPGSGPRLVGVSVQNVATQVELFTSSVEVLARAIEFYVESQQSGVAEAFPPPHEVAGQFRRDLEPLREAAFGGGP